MNPKQRPRGRGNNSGNNNGGKKHVPTRNQLFDSASPEGRIRGNAHQVLERYLGMARDASAQGDRVAAENYYQHAEHYFRVINAHNQNNGRPRPVNTPTPAEDQNMPAEGDEDGETSESTEATEDSQSAEPVGA